MFARRKYLWIVGAVVIALGVGGWLYSRSGSQTQYQTATVERGSVQASISATGNTNAVVTVQVGSQVSGNIKALYADFNTKVKKGQLVAQIDPQAFQARVDQARASLDSANSNVVSARAQIQKAEADIASARAALWIPRPRRTATELNCRLRSKRMARKARAFSIAADIFRRLRTIAAFSMSSANLRSS